MECEICRGKGRVIHPRLHPLADPAARIHSLPRLPGHRPAVMLRGHGRRPDEITNNSREIGDLANQNRGIVAKKPQEEITEELVYSVEDVWKIRARCEKQMLCAFPNCLC